MRRKNENSLWTGHSLNQGLARMSNAGRVEGLEGISQGLGLDLKPYVVGNVSSAPGRGQSSPAPDGDIGIDAFYNLTPALRANLSVNTDFAETEVDERRVNLTRFPLFFEEKRDFFLEGSSFFDFSREPDEAVMPFFSRRIGRDDRGAPQRIDFGAKLIGQAGPFDVGVLQVRTGQADSLAGEDFTVLRLRRRAFQQSYVGGLYTRRSVRVPALSTSTPPGSTSSCGRRTFRGDRNVDASGFYVQTSNPLATGNSAAYGLRASYPNDPVTLELSVREIQPNYFPAVGFVERRGYRRVNPRADYAPRFRNHPWIQGLEFRTDLDIQNDTENRPLTRDLQFRPIEINFRDGSEFGIDVSRQYQRLEEDFEISDDVILPSGAVYEFTRYRFSGSTAAQYVVSVEAEVEIGDFFSGRRQDYLFELGVRPRRGVALTLEAEHNQLELAEGRFDTNVFRVTANTQVSPWISLVNNLQYNTVSRELGWQMRFRWIRRPGNDLYVVYTHNWNEVQRRTAPGHARYSPGHEAGLHAALLISAYRRSSRFPARSHPLRVRFPPPGAQAITFAMTGANGRRACDAVPCSEIAGRWSGLQAPRGSAGHTSRATASSVCPTRSRDHHPTPSVNSLECYFGNLPSRSPSSRTRIWAAR